MYDATLFVHSLLRWVVILVGLLAVLRPLTRWKTSAPWTPTDDRVASFFTISLDAQALVGFLLYLLISPITTITIRDIGRAMDDRVLRFWTVEHVTMMVAALAVAHIGRVRVRRADGRKRAHRVAAIFFGVALLFILLGTPWPFLPYGRRLLPW